MGWNCWNHYRCQFTKLYQGEVGQSLEQIWCDSHCSQYILNINRWVYGLSHPLLNLTGSEEFMGVARNRHAMENSHVFFVHILQYLLTIWDSSEIITIKRSITLTWRRHLWSKMKMRREMFQMNSSLYSSHENLSYTL